VTLLVLVFVIVPGIPFPDGETGIALAQNDIFISGLNELMLLEGRESFFDWSVFPEFGVSDTSRTALENRFSLDITIDNFSIGGRFDFLSPGYYLEDRSFVGSSSMDRVRYFDMRKKHIEYDDGTFRCRVGDFSELFGRGLALNLFEDPGMNIDRELDGALFELRKDLFGFTVLAGRGDYHYYNDKPYNVGDANPFDGRDFIRAFSAELHSSGGLTEGFGYVRMDDALTCNPGGEIEGGARNEKVFLFLNSNFGVGGFYAEGVNSWTHTHENETGTGIGIYTGLNLFVGEMGLNFDYKYYSKEDDYWDVSLGDTPPYYDPPPVRIQHDLSTLSRLYRATDPNDETGWMLTLNYSPDYMSTYSLGAAVSSRIAEGSVLPFRRRELMPESEIVFNADKDYETGSNFHLTLDYLEHWDSTDYDGVKTYLTGGVSMEKVLREQYTLGWEFELQRISEERLRVKRDRNLPDGDYRYWDGILTVLFEMSPWFSFHVTSEITNELDVLKKLSDGPYIPGKGEPLKDDYISVGTDFQLTDGYLISIIYGSVRGGKLCHGGVCRDVPAFNGLRLDFTSSF